MTIYDVMRRRRTLHEWGDVFKKSHDVPKNKNKSNDELKTNEGMISGEKKRKIGSKANTIHVQ